MIFDATIAVWFLAGAPSPFVRDPLSRAPRNDCAHGAQ